MVWKGFTVSGNPAKEEVGESLYVFSNNGGLQNSKSCVIDSHGIQYPMGNTRKTRFEVPEGVTVKFYVPHGSSQQYENKIMRFSDNAKDYAFTTDLQDIMQKHRDENGLYREELMKELETFKGGELCPNYILTKIQHTSTGPFGGAVNNYLGNRNKMTYDDMIKFIEDQTDTNRAHWMKDIVTIRNRPFKKPLSLQDVIRTLMDHNYDYSEVHCLFCRSPIVFGGLPSESPVRRNTVR